MGEMIQLRCKTCSLVRDESIGIGMAGVGDELCACYRCHRFVLKRLKWDHSGQLQCPYCRSAIRPIKNGDACAICGDPVTIESLGVWD